MKLSTKANVLQSREVISNIQMPFALAHKFYKFFSECEKDSDFYSEQMRKIYMECAQLGEDGNPIYDEKGNLKIDPSKVAEGNRKIDELNNTDVIEPSITFTSAEMEALEGLTFQQIIVFEPFIKD